jgi:MFS transporter, DHA1 family, multidrug resistance protein
MSDWRRQFLALLLVQLLVCVAHGMYVPILASHLRAIGLAGEALVVWTGIAFAGNFCAMMLAMPMLGRLGDRIGRKPIMIWSGIGMTLITAAMALTQHPLELAVLRFLQGCFTGILPFSMILVVTGAPKDRVSTSTGLMQTMAESGMMLGPLIGSAAMLFLPASQAFPLTSLFIAAATIGVWRLVREPERAAPAGERTNLLQDFAAIWRRKPFTQLLIGAFCTNFCLVGTSPMLVFYIERADGAWWDNGLSVGFALAISSIAVILFAPVLGRLADRVGPLPLLKASAASAVALSVIQAWADSYTVIVACRFLMGVCAASMLPNIQAQIRAYLQTGMEARTFGIANAWQFMGSLAGPTLGGVIVASFGVSSWFWTTALVFAISCWQAYRIGAANAALRRQSAATVQAEGGI